MNSPLRTAICGSLIVFGVIIVGGLLALLPRAIEAVAVAKATSSQQSARPPAMASRPASTVEEEFGQIAVATAPAVEQALEQKGTSTADIQPPDVALRGEIEEPLPDASVQRPVADERPVAAPEVKTPVQAAPKKRVRRTQDAKRSTNEALRTVRKFDDDLRDIPVNAYAAGRTKRPLDIRPTSIQDVYYYSVPR